MKQANICSSVVLYFTQLGDNGSKEPFRLPGLYDAFSDHLESYFHTHNVIFIAKNCRPMVAKRCKIVQNDKYLPKFTKDCQKLLKLPYVVKSCHGFLKFAKSCKKWLKVAKTELHDPDPWSLILILSLCLMYSYKFETMTDWPWWLTDKGC